jgi:hypothetical protein
MDLPVTFTARHEIYIFIYSGIRRELTDRDKSLIDSHLCSSPAT